MAGIEWETGRVRDEFDTTARRITAAWISSYCARAATVFVLNLK
jgi:hypothetical protein